MKGAPKMSQKKNPFNTVFPMFQGMMPMMPPVLPPMPPVPPMPNFNSWNNDASETCDDFNSSMMKFWKQTIEAQKSTMEGFKDQWNQFFENNMEMWDTFADSLPDEAPNLPGVPASKTASITPKKIVKRAKKFQEIANKHMVEQADTAVDFAIKGQEEAVDIVSKVVDDIKEKNEEKKAETEEAAEVVDEEATVK